MNNNLKVINRLDKNLQGYIRKNIEEKLNRRVSTSEEGWSTPRKGEAGKTINCPLITPGQRHIMGPDSFMTIYGAFRRGARPALGLQAPYLPWSSNPVLAPKVLE